MYGIAKFVDAMLAPCTGFEPASLSANGFQDRALTTRTHGILASMVGFEPTETNLADLAGLWFKPTHPH